MTRAVQLDRCARVVNGGTPTSDEANWSGEIPWATPEDLGTQRDMTLKTTRRTLTTDGLATSNAGLVPAGSIILSTRAPIGHVAIAGTPMAFNQGCRALVPGQNQESRFLYYAVLAHREALKAEGRGSTFTELSGQQLASFKILLPTPARQRLIADFLDRETHRIDALVDAKKRLRSRLAEKATAVITHGVTRGMDFSKRMRFVPGLPPLEIPEHWEAQRLAVVMKQITNGYVGPTRDILVDDGVRYVQSLHIKEGRIDFHTPYCVSEQWSAARSRTRLRQGDLLLVQTGDIGQSAVVTSEFDGAQCHALIIMRRRRSHDEARYFGYALRSSAVRSAILKTATGALHPHLNVGLVRDVRVPVPPADEQRAIVSWIDRKLEAIDGARKAIDSQLDLLAEYRQALITQAVTGQLVEATLKGDKPVDEAVGVIPE